MHVEDVMRAVVDMASASTPAEQAWHDMRQSRLRVLAVTDDTGIIGLVTRAQLECGGAPKRRDRKLADFVRADLVAVRSDCSLSHAANVLRGRMAGCVPVLRGQHLVGVLTIADLLRRLTRTAGHRRPRARSAGALS